MVRLSTTILIFLTIIIALYFRFDDIIIWEKNKQSFYYLNKIPLFTSYDAFFFARWAKDYNEGIYQSEKLDPLRFVPDNYLDTENKIVYPNPVPLVSFLLSKISKFTGKTYEEISFWIIPIFSIFFIFPLTLLFIKSGFCFAGLFGSLLGSISLIYVVRSSIVRLDTDTLNLFFPFCFVLTLYFYWLNKNNKTKRIIFLFLAGIINQLYYWWYLHPGLNLLFTLLFLSFLINIKLSPKKFPKISLNTLLIKDFLLLLLFSNPYILLKGVLNFYKLTKIYLISYFKLAIDYGFPNVFHTISEAKQFDIITIGKLTSGHYVIFTLGIAGYFLILTRKPRIFILLSPIFLIGAMCFFGGNRFAMYLAPFVGIGLGAFLDILKDSHLRFLSPKRLKILTILIALFFFIIIIYISPSRKFVASPKISPQLYGDFIRLQEITPPNAWIWTWWDYGTAIQYLGRRAVYHDPQSQGSPKTYFIAKSFTTSSQKEMVNIVKGISSVGNIGIKKFLEKNGNAENLLKKMLNGYFNDKTKHPIYIVLTPDLITKFAAVYYLGEWDLKEKKGKALGYTLLGNCSLLPKSGILKCQKALINSETGRILFQKGNKIIDFLVREVVILKPKVTPTKLSFINEETNRSPFALLIVQSKTSTLAFLAPWRIYETTFNKLFFLRDWNRKLFELVYDDFPNMVVYKVK